ncbi:regulator of chromosome condensation domain-containing protein [Campylobacter iguaniorum]|uniref:RCC1 domain-containing protein n=1 Tax=Campylobacter iguaniorum TaxID=1244531 RepID=UPI00073A205B|nr:hypothetical protein [Campylobacter iguaniorum]ALV24552.1 regulator of chromosome condensation domain-containing protein [Campylobacter iguaniorum]
MKYYKNKTNQVYAFDEPLSKLANSKIIELELVAITKKEADELLAQSEVDEVYSNRSITYLSKSTINNFMLVKDGDVYVTSNNQVSDVSILGVPSSNGRFAYGFNNLRKVYLPGKVKDAFCAGASAWALLENGELYAWGYNTVGQLGLRHTTHVYKPTLSATNVECIYGNINIANTGYYDHLRMFIKKSDGYIYSTGYNIYGACGNGTTTTVTSWYKITTLGTNVTKIYNNGDIYGNAIAIKDDNSIWVAGYNGYGQLGTGNTNVVSTFKDVTNKWGGKNQETLEVQALCGHSSNDTHNNYCNTLILRKDSVNTYLYSSGYYQYGASLSATTSTPVMIANMSNVKQLVHLSLDTWVLKNDGSVYACGYNTNNSLGLNNTSLGAIFNKVPISNVKRLIPLGTTTAVSWYGLRVLLEKDDGYYVSGTGEMGILGTGSTTNANIPTKMDFESDVRLVDAGGYSYHGYGKSYIALDTKGRLWAWGYNGHKGVLDSGGTGNILSPILIGGGYENGLR